MILGLDSSAYSLFDVIDLHELKVGGFPDETVVETANTELRYRYALAGLATLDVIFLTTINVNSRGMVSILWPDISKLICGQTSKLRRATRLKRAVVSPSEFSLVVNAAGAPVIKA
jgi:hypothetical protein